MPRNGRRVALRLTDDGRALRERATAARLSWLGGVVAYWSPDEVRTLASALTHFADAVAERPPPGPG